MRAGYRQYLIYDTCEGKQDPAQGSSSHTECERVRLVFLVDVQRGCWSGPALLLTLQLPSSSARSQMGRAV